MKLEKLPSKVELDRYKALVMHDTATQSAQLRNDQRFFSSLLCFAEPKYKFFMKVIEKFCLTTPVHNDPHSHFSYSVLSKFTQVLLVFMFLF